jgi:hypothetical protein
MIPIADLPEQGTDKNADNKDKYDDDNKDKYDDDDKDKYDDGSDMDKYDDTSDKYDEYTDGADSSITDNGDNSGTAENIPAQTEPIVKCEICDDNECLQAPDEIFPDKYSGIELTCGMMETFAFSSGVKLSYCSLMKTYVFLGSCGGCGPANCILRPRSDHLFGRQWEH